MIRNQVRLKSSNNSCGRTRTASIFEVALFCQPLFRAVCFNLECNLKTVLVNTDGVPSARIEVPIPSQAQHRLLPTPPATLEMSLRHGKAGVWSGNSRAPEGGRRGTADRHLGPAGPLFASPRFHGCSLAEFFQQRCSHKPLDSSDLLQPLFLRRNSLRKTFLMFCYEVRWSLNEKRLLLAVLGSLGAGPPWSPTQRPRLGEQFRVEPSVVCTQSYSFLQS